MDDLIGAPTRHKLDVGTFHRMGEAGLFAPGDRIELIEGDLIDMAPIGQGHAAAVDGLAEALFSACAGRAIVRVQGPIRIDGHSEPQPDFAVLRRRADFYAAGEPPGPRDVLLVVEVADSSLRFDQSVKLMLYARSGIGEYWVVDLAQRVVRAYREPAGDGYAAVRTHVAGERLALAMAPEIVVPLHLVW